MKKTTLYTDLENVNFDNIDILSLKKTPNMNIFNITYNYNNIQNNPAICNQTFFKKSRIIT